MTKEQDDRVYQGLPADPSDSRIWGAGTAGNVAGAVGSFFSGSGGGGGRSLMADPSTYTAGGSSSTSSSTSSVGGGDFTRPATAPAATASPSSWNPLTSSGAGASGLMQAAASPGSIIQRSIQQSLANRATKRTAATGTQSAAGAGINRGSPGNWTSNVQLKMPTMTAGRQQAIDNRAVRQTPAERARDPLNWKGIARDLGNAGDPRFRQHATGGPASSSAMKLVGTQKAAAKAEVNRGKAANSASKATRAASKTNKRGGKNTNRAV